MGENKRKASDSLLGSLKIKLKNYGRLPPLHCERRTRAVDDEAWEERERCLMGGVVTVTPK